MEFAALSNGGGFFYSSSSLPMRSLNMIAPSRGMATPITPSQRALNYVTRFA